jgi:hypothetical protein
MIDTTVRRLSWRSWVGWLLFAGLLVMVVITR